MGSLLWSHQCQITVLVQKVGVSSLSSLVLKITDYTGLYLPAETADLCFLLCCYVCFTHVYGWKAQPQILTGYQKTCASEAPERPELHALVPMWPYEIFNSHTLELLIEVWKLYHDQFWTCFRTSVGQLVQFISMSSWRWERQLVSCRCCRRRPRCPFCTLSVDTFVRGGRKEGNKTRKVLKEWRKGHFFHRVIIAFCVKTLVPNQQSRKRKKIANY